MLGVFIGLASVDMCYALEDLPPRNEKAKAPDLWTTAGGPALNAALTYARLGGEACIYTAASPNGIGKIIHDHAQAVGLRVMDCNKNPGYIPVATIVIHPSNGDRTVISCNKNDIPLTMPAAPLEKPAGFYFWDGYYTGILDKLGLFKAAGNRPTIYDGGSWKDYNRPYINDLTCPIVSEKFLQTRAAQEWSKAYLAAGGELIITGGEKDVLYKYQDKVEHIPVPAITVVDTLGAGDVFHGAFCFARFVRQDDTRTAIMFASCIAGYSCRQRTPHWWQADDAVAFFEQWKTSAE